MVSVNPLSALTDFGDASKSKVTIANDFDTFLKLLTTQLQNQNPLEPLDTNQFTQQLVQFSEVEQGIKTNENLERLLLLQTANAITGSVSYIGKTVELAGATQPLKDNSATWPLKLGADAQNTTLTIKDADGNLVFSETKSFSAGDNSYEWNGLTNENIAAAEGNYTLSVSATNNEGTGVNVNIASSGIVEGVDLGGNSLFLIVGGQKIKLEEVTSIYQ